MSSTQSKTFSLGGGLDLATSPLELDPGRCIAAKNYECVADGGYRLIKGFERVDGRGLPSEAEYKIVYFNTGTEAIADETAITQAGATGYCLTQILESGTYVGGDAAGYLVISEITGTFADSTAIKVGGATKCVAASTAQVSTDDDLHSTYSQLAIEFRRTLIGAVPGDGQIRGVWTYNGVDYAFRDDTSGTPDVCKMYKATTSGWTLVDLGKTIAFTSGGTYVIAETNTITGATSGATATVKRVVLTSGAFADGDAAGYLVISGQTGSFSSENLNVGANLNVATVAGNSTAISLTNGGNFKFVNYNFYGNTSGYRMYGCDGVNKAFEFDGTTFTPITTGMAIDAPTHIFAHQSYLFLAYPGGSLQQSSIGEPLYWDAAVGDAAEYAVGDTITGLVAAAGGLMAILCRNRISLMYGTTSTDFQLKPHSLTVGALANTGQNMDAPVFLDDNGLTNLVATQDFGDMKTDAFSSHIDDWLTETKRNAAISSVKVREASQYRIFFSDNTALYVTLKNNRVVGIMPIDLGLPVRCVSSGESATGAEIVLAGSDDGYIYRMQSGDSLDGDDIEAFVCLAYNHYGAPSQKKRFRRVTIDMDAKRPGIVLRFLPEFSYGSPYRAESSLFTSTVDGGGGRYGSDNWLEFYYGSQAVGQASSRCDGTGLNMGMIISHASSYQGAHTLYAVTTLFDFRGLQR